MEFAASGLAALMGRTGLPGWATREGFKLLGPVKTLRSRVKFLRQLHDREALLPHERQRRFVESEGWIEWPAPALADAMRQVIAQIRRACSPPEDGDYGLAGSADTLVTTVNGIVAGSAVEDALGALDAIDLSVTYAVPGPDGNDLAATAVTLRPGHSLDDAQGRPAPGARPRSLRVRSGHRWVPHCAIRRTGRRRHVKASSRRLPINALSDRRLTRTGQFGCHSTTSSESHEQRFGRPFDDGPFAYGPVEVRGDQRQAAYSLRRADGWRKTSEVQDHA